MIPINQKITRTGTGFTALEWREYLKVAWDAAGVFWHRFILPKHFTRGAIQEYNYQPRKKNYSIKKGKIFGHQRPLELSGNLKRTVVRIRDVRASSKGARVILHGPTYLYAYRKDLLQPDKAAELRAISERDSDAIAKVIDNKLKRIINQSSKTVNITGGHRR